MSNFVELLSTVRVGQLTGTTDVDKPESNQKWPLLVDAEQWPLLTDTGRWDVIGVDLGTTTEHNGRLYIFFGDVATKHSGIPLNADLVVWTDEPKVLRHGGHLPLGWKFVLPHEPTNVSGQTEWRFCGKCGGLFYDGCVDFKGVCHKGGSHEAIGLKFVIPARETGAEVGQPNWRYCGKCASLFYDGYDTFKGVCPKDGSHSAVGWTFLLTFEPTNVQGQQDWRYCEKCAGLFWDGGAHKGLCLGAPGGGFHLNAVLRRDGWFAPFTGTEPVGQTLSYETPNGAFSYAGKVWVFAGFPDSKYSNHKRPGDPAPGCYLTSNEHPDQEGLYQTEFLFSPRIGWCPRDASRDRLESHTPLGYKFLLSHDIPEGPNRQANYCFCRKCAMLFWNGDGQAINHCYRGGSHEAAGHNFLLLESVDEDVQNQANWHRCAKCSSIFWNGDHTNGLCPAGEEHKPTPHNLLLTHLSIEDDMTNQTNWRYCSKCFALFFDGYDAKGICPQDGTGHSPIGYNFVLPHSISETVEAQANWRYCGKCFALFFDGYDAKGICPQDGTGHSAIGYNFVLPHNPGEDRLTQGGWRFCTKCHGVVWTGQEDTFTWVATWVVRTTDHPGLPQSPHELGLVMLGFGYSSNPGIRLAWMPLKSPAAPMLQDILYYTCNPSNRWTMDAADAVAILPHTNTYTHLSVAWLDGPRRWILLYSNANDESGQESYHLPAVARIGTSLWEWSDEVEIFNPYTQNAYDRYMYRVGGRPIHPNIPPSQDPAKAPHDGWAYGAFLLNRYTEWNAATRELGIYYLLSLSSPYQVQLMYTKLRLG